MCDRHGSGVEHRMRHLLATLIERQAVTHSNSNMHQYQRTPCSSRNKTTETKRHRSMYPIKIKKINAQPCSVRHHHCSWIRHHMNVRLQLAYPIPSSTTLLQIKGCTTNGNVLSAHPKPTRHRTVSYIHLAKIIVTQSRVPSPLQCICATHGVIMVL